MIDPKSPVRFIDLFSGCGGFSLGLEQAGLECVAAIDHDVHAVNSLGMNHGSEGVALERDLTRFLPEELAELIGLTSVEVIIGGPPCQGFSTARQTDGSNSGSRLVEDPRRDLYKVFLKYVSFFRPKVFVMENVLGIKKLQNGIYFTAIQNEARRIGYRVLPVEINCWEYGVPQKRVRQLFIGTLVNLPIFAPTRYLRKTHSLHAENDNLLPIVTLGEAIEDLPPLRPGDERVIQDYDQRLRQDYLEKYSGDYLFNVLNVSSAEKLTWHCARPQSERDLRDFERLREGETSRQAIARGVTMEFPYDRTKFKDRYTRQSRDGLCSTIVAHLRSDGLMFIHPTQVRSLTPREAARIQSFPDTFRFSGTRSNVFTQIGNAVPPRVGRSVGLGIAEYLEALSTTEESVDLSDAEREKLIQEIERFVDNCYIKSIEFVADDEFIVIWQKILRLVPHLHPESALDNGTEISPPPRRGVSSVLEPYYVRSGWPVDLVLIAKEANRRFRSNELDVTRYFPEVTA